MSYISRVMICSVAICIRMRSCAFMGFCLDLILFFVCGIWVFFLSLWVCIVLFWLYAFLFVCLYVFFVFSSFSGLFVVEVVFV